MYAAEFTLELSTQTLSLLCKVSFHLFSGSQAAVVLQTFCSRCLCVSSPRPPISSVIIFLKWGVFFALCLELFCILPLLLNDRQDRAASLSAVVCICQTLGSWSGMCGWWLESPILICPEYFSARNYCISNVTCYLLRPSALRIQGGVCLKYLLDSSATVVGPLRWGLCRRKSEWLKSMAVGPSRWIVGAAILSSHKH